MDLLNDLFKPVLLLLVGALSYFLKKEFAEIKGDIKLIKEDLRTKYVETRDCERTLADCREDRRERKTTCDSNMREMRTVVGELVNCVNKKFDDCDVRTP